MPRTYVRKRQPSYSPQDLGNAVNDVLNKNKTYREAQEHYGVPIAVIYHRIKGRKVPIEKLGAGRPPVLDAESENQIALCLIARARMGYPCDKEELKNLVSEYVKANNIKGPFKENRPGEDWYQSFMKRHPTLSLKKAEHLQTCRNMARDPDKVYDFYEKLEILYNKCGLKDGGKASYVYNCDESGFPSDSSKLRGIGEKGKPLSRISGGSGRESTTVLLCASADGSFLPPLIIFKGAAVQARWTSEESYPGTRYAASANGWMEEPFFFSWFKEEFVPHIHKIRRNNVSPNQTAVLIFDGHNSHVSIRLVQEAIDSNIELVRLPSHLTDRIQPLDKCVFGPVMVKWDKKLVQHGKQHMGNVSSRLSKQQFSIFLGQVLQEAVTPIIVKTGFISTGLFPIDASKFLEEIFDPVDLQRYKSKKKQKISLSGETPNIEPEIVNTKSLENNATSTPQKEIICENEESSIPLDHIHTATRNLNVHLRQPFQEEATPKSVIDIFSQVIKTTISERADKTTGNKTKTPISRLKQLSYGEVLTTPEVLNRLKEADEKKKLKGLPKKKGKISSKGQSKASKSSDEVEKILSDGEMSEEESFETWKNNIEIESTPEVEYTQPKKETLVPGAYILIDFLGGKRNTAHFTYACVINSVNKNEYEVTGLKSIDLKKTTFIYKENDTFTTDFLSIKALLPTPSIIVQDRKLVYVFPGAVRVNEQ